MKKQTGEVHKCAPWWWVHVPFARIDQTYSHPDQAWSKANHMNLMGVTWPLQDSDVCGRSLTCMLEACSHALVKLAPPLPGSQLLVLLTGLQGEAVPLCLGRQVRCSLLSLLHQGTEVGLPTLYAHDCEGKQSAASVNHVHDLTGNQFSLCNNPAYDWQTYE